MNSPSESQREPALTVRREARPFYAALFVLQTLGLVARRFYIALTERSDSFWTALGEANILDVAAVSLSQLERDGAKAVISTILMMEVWDIMMGTRDAINDWLEKRRRQARAEGIAEGRAEGITQGIAEGEIRGRAEIVAQLADWNERRLTAEANGEPFDEPPPGLNGQNPGT